MQHENITEMFLRWVKKKLNPLKKMIIEAILSITKEDKNVENSESPEENDAAGKVLVDTLKAFEIITQRFQSVLGNLADSITNLNSRLNLLEDNLSELESLKNDEEPPKEEESLPSNDQDSDAESSGEKLGSDE